VGGGRVGGGGGGGGVVITICRKYNACQREKHFSSNVHMLYLPRNKFINVKTFRKNIAHVYLHILCAHIKFRENR
jgi:hypothetical protein